MNNLIKDLSVLTTIPELNLQKLCNLSTECISHSVVESVKENNPICEIDVGIGVILINIVPNEELMFKFIPSKKLQNSILETIESKESSLTLDVEDALKDKILYAYKNLI